MYTVFSIYGYHIDDMLNNMDFQTLHRNPIILRYYVDAYILVPKLYLKMEYVSCTTHTMTF